MLPKMLIRRLNPRRLRYWLALFFLALGIPTAVLVYQAYSQLKWEAFHQYQSAAEELTRRVDARLGGLIRAADAQSFADYTFLNVTGDPAAKFVQRSPLSNFPVSGEIAGVIGYFQVNSAGTFSSPLLPAPGADTTTLGIGAGEYRERQALAQQIQSILADNRLVRSRTDLDTPPSLTHSFDAPAAPVEVPEQEAGRLRERQAASEEEPADLDSVSSPAPQAAATGKSYSQLVFDELSPLQPAAEPAAASRDAELKDEAVGDNLSRSKRREQTNLPETLPEAAGGSVAGATSNEIVINTFESEVDPFEFSLLDSGHFVLFRKVWRDGERYIQGALIDQTTFVQTLIGDAFADTALSDMSDLSVVYNDAVIQTYSGRPGRDYSNVGEELDGQLLYRSRLSVPLNGLALVFDIRHLPPGPGASVLGWVTLVLALVFAGGFVGLYRLGLGQISLAQQQQDFVSAVSHELKTPLTSIRMYGEMLKEGWAEPDKRQKYYEFIHDESERLSRLIANVLELAKITRSEPQFKVQPISVGDLMRDIKGKIAAQAEKAGFELRFAESDAASRAVINIDEDCFAQIVINLVDNAIKFAATAEQKVIEITSKLTSRNDVVIAVRDFGPGIPRNQMQKIFELFYRAGPELTRESVGTGIGLAIVHQLTLAMNGSVDVVNVEPGAEFRLSFPGAAVSSSRKLSPS